jgi:hypothetical protein
VRAGVGWGGWGGGGLSDCASGRPQLASSLHCACCCCRCRCCRCHRCFCRCAAANRPPTQPSTHRPGCLPGCPALPAALPAAPRASTPPSGPTSPPLLTARRWTSSSRPARTTVRARGWAEGAEGPLNPTRRSLHRQQHRGPHPNSPLRPALSSFLSFCCCSPRCRRVGHLQPDW